MSSKYALLLGLTLMISGCYEVHDLVVEGRDGKLIFTTTEPPAAGLAADVLTVTRIDCATDCVYWQIKRRPETFDEPTALVPEGQLAYGQLPSQMYAVAGPKPLVGGQYNVSGDIRYPLDDGKLAGGVYSQDFVVDIQQGEVVVQALH